MTLTTDPPDTGTPDRTASTGSSDLPAGPSRLARADAEALGDRIQQQAALIAEATCQFLLMLAEFNQRGGIGWYIGLKSTAHWLSWACSISPGTAREHVRVARTLPTMPLTVAAFSQGRLSYSKVREMTRVADHVDEATLVDLACAMTASQLARTLSSFRAVNGARLGQDAIRQARWMTREDGMIEILAVLPPEEGAELLTALDLALARDGHDTNADALTRNVPAGTPPHPTGTPPLCHVIGQDTPLEPATAERLACTGKIALQITNDTGEVLYLGRPRRLASPAQRRALRLRDRTCSFPWLPPDPPPRRPPRHPLVRRQHHRHRQPGPAVPAPPHDRPRRQPPPHPRAGSPSGSASAPLHRDRPARTARQRPLARHARTHHPHPHHPDMPEPTGHPDRITGTTSGYGFHLADCVDTLLNATLTTAA